MNIFAALLALAAIIGPAVGETDFCDKSLCVGYGKGHLGCGNTPTIADTCPKDTVLLPWFILHDIILHKINTIRNRSAGGLKGCRLGTIKWDHDMAYLAEITAARCKVEEECIETKTYKNSFQRHVTGIANDEYDAVEQIKKTFDDYFNMNIIDDYDRFLNTWTEINYRIGCAASMYTVPGEELKFLFVCNYGTLYSDNIVEEYHCYIPGMGCHTGTNPLYPNLCSSVEEYIYH